MKNRKFLRSLSIILILNLILGINQLSVITQGDNNTIQPGSELNTTINLIVGELEKFKVVDVEKNDDIVISMECEACTILFFITSDLYYNDIISKNADPAEVAEIYLEDQTSIEEIPYQIPSAGTWWVFVDNSDGADEVDVAITISLKSSNVNSTFSFEIISLIFSFSVIVLMKKKF